MISMWKGIEKQDRYMLISSIFVPLALWWAYIGRHKYGMKGLR